ncbi:MAG: Universal stress protein [Nocardioidaceae bacterium]|nr:Universal stress protein [Nocardioidaceae bacterium]
MNTSDAREIVVALDDGVDAFRSLSFAVAEAARSRCAIRLVHVVKASLPPPPSDGLIELSDLSVGTHHFANVADMTAADVLLEDAADEVRRIAGTAIDVTTAAPVGTTVHTLVDECQTALLAIVQHHHRSVLGTVFSRSIRVGLSSRAPCPVVTIPEDWKAAPAHQRVLVALDDVSSSIDLLEVGLEAARARGAVLKVVHAWNITGPYEEMIASPTQAEEWMQSAHHDIDRALAAVGDRYRSVTVERLITPGSPADALRRESATADLLILGRQGHKLGPTIGSVARTLIKHASCPVEVRARKTLTNDPLASPLSRSFV